MGKRGPQTRLDSENRTENIKVPVTAEEKQGIFTTAKAAGYKSTAAYLRDLALNRVHLPQEGQ